MTGPRLGAGLGPEAREVAETKLRRSQFAGMGLRGVDFTARISSSCSLNQTSAGRLSCKCSFSVGLLGSLSLQLDRYSKPLPPEILEFPLLICLPGEVSPVCEGATLEISAEEGFDFNPQNLSPKPLGRPLGNLEGHGCQVPHVN